MLNTILSAFSLLVLLIVVFFWVRSYWRFDGILHYSEGEPVTVTASNNGKTVDAQFQGHSSGLISYSGQMAYVSIVNPIKAADWEGWSSPVEAKTGTGPAALVSDVRVQHSGLRFGSAKTQSELRDPVLGVAWQLPYHFVILPYWILAILLGIMPWRWLAAYRLALTREKQGLCIRCGASVRGLTGNCPKCGEPID